MNIILYNAYIDPTSKNIMTPEALTEYLASKPRSTISVPDFCPTDDFTIPIETGTAAYCYAVIQWETVNRYYFVTVTESPDQANGVFNYRFAIDWAHTLRCGLTSRKFAPRSILTRTNCSSSLDSYDQDRSRLASVECLGNVGSDRAFNIVAIYAVKRAGSLFSAATYQYVGMISPRVDSTVDGSLRPALAVVHRMMKAVSFEDSTSAVVAKDDCSPVAFYILPAQYCPQYESFNFTLYDAEGHNAGSGYKPTASLLVYTKTLSYGGIDWRGYAYEIGNNSKRVTWRSNPRPITTQINVYTTFTLSATPGEFSITANIDGNVLDLTESCAIPFVIANESEINVQVNKRNLSLLSAGIQIAGGVAGQNASMIYSGAMSAASSVAEMASTSFPSIRGSGNLYTDSILNFGGVVTTDILKVFKYELTSMALYKNYTFGMIGRYRMSKFPPFTNGYVYMEGDTFPLPENYLESQNLSRMKEIFDGGIRVYETATGYLS